MIVKGRVDSSKPSRFAILALRRSNIVSLCCRIGMASLKAMHDMFNRSCVHWFLARNATSRHRFTQFLKVAVVM